MKLYVLLHFTMINTDMDWGSSESMLVINFNEAYHGNNPCNLTEKNEKIVTDSLLPVPNGICLKSEPQEYKNKETSNVETQKSASFSGQQKYFMRDNVVIIDDSSDDEEVENLEKFNKPPKVNNEHTPNKIFLEKMERKSAILPILSLELLETKHAATQIVQKQNETVLGKEQIKCMSLKAFEKPHVQEIFTNISSDGDCEIELKPESGFKQIQTVLSKKTVKNNVILSNDIEIDFSDNKQEKTDQQNKIDELGVTHPDLSDTDKLKSSMLKSIRDLEKIENSRVNFNAFQEMEGDLSIKSETIFIEGKLSAQEDNLVKTAKTISCVSQFNMCNYTTSNQSEFDSQINSTFEKELYNCKELCTINKQHPSDNIDKHYSECSIDKLDKIGSHEHSSKIILFNGNSIQVSDEIEYIDSANIKNVPWKYQGNKQLKCSYCSFISKHKKSMIDHLDLHTVHNQPIIHCPHCEYTAPMKTLYRHLTSEHNQHSKSSMLKAKRKKIRRNPRRLFGGKRKCEFCSFRTDMKTSWHNHQLSHTKDKMPILNCPHCSYKSTKQALDSHIRTHKICIKLDSPIKNVLQELPKTKKELTARDAQSDNGLSNSTKGSIIVQAMDIKEIRERNSLDHSKVKHNSQLNCQICSYSASSRVHLERHVNSHMVYKKPVYKCKACPFRGPTYFLAEHSKIHQYDGKTYTCNKCSFATNVLKVLELHGSVHKIVRGGPIYRCNKCSFKTKYKQSLRQHENRNRDSVKCNSVNLGQCLTERVLCKKKRSLAHLACTEKDCSFDKSFRTHSSEDSNIPIECHKTLSLKNDEKQQNYSCYKCAYFGKTKQNFEKHLKLHKSSGKVSLYNCPKCIFKTIHKNNLVRHIKINKNRPQCNISKHKFKYLSLQIKSKKGNIKFPDIIKGFSYCDECDYKNRNIKFLKRHKQIAHSVFLSCDMCDYVTKVKGALTRHKNSHQTENLHFTCIKNDSLSERLDDKEVKSNNLICTECGFVAIHQDALISHQIIYHNMGEKDVIATRYENAPSTTKEYSCKTCNFKTSQENSLLSHQVIHINITKVEIHKNKNYNFKILNGVKWYYCRKCPYKTRHSSGICKHFKVHHGSEDYLHCDKCNYKTNNREYLLSHKNIHDKKNTIVLRGKKGITIDGYESKHSGSECDDECSDSSSISRPKCIRRAAVTSKSNKTDTTNLNSDDSDLENLLDHIDIGDSILKTISTRSFGCSLCDFVAKNDSELQNHLLNHKKDELKCEQCNYKTHSGKNLKLHKHYCPKKVYRDLNCDKCQKSFSCKTVLDKHKLSHTMEKNKIFVCKTCNFKSKYHSSLKKHLSAKICTQRKVKSEPKNHISILSCDNCRYRTNSELSFQEHRLNCKKPSATANESKEALLFKCSQCFYKTEHKMTLTKHFNMCHVENSND